jgi:cytochrome c5
MKKIIALSCLALITLAVACKTKKSETASAVAPKNEIVSATLYDVAKKKYPAITQADLDEGEKLYSTDCVRCHSAKAIDSRDEAQWTNAVNKMAPKAKLNEIQKIKVLQYVLSLREKEAGK